MPDDTHHVGRDLYGLGVLLLRTDDTIAQARQRATRPSTLESLVDLINAYAAEDERQRRLARNARRRELAAQRRARNRAA